MGKYKLWNWRTWGRQAATKLRSEVQLDGLSLKHHNDWTDIIICSTPIIKNKENITSVEYMVLFEKGNSLVVGLGKKEFKVRK